MLSWGSESAKDHGVEHKQLLSFEQIALFSVILAASMIRGQERKRDAASGQEFQRKEDDDEREVGAQFVRTSGLRYWA